ncbi:MAG: ABC transporter ATP-binding protein [Lewinellaceae bacterium]|nr:ABC transporter ATP-binding protein [Lewinellaceae bacterium]
MSKTVIRVENLSKQYRLGQVGTGTLSHDLNRWWHQIRGKEDPYLKIGETNDRASKAESEYVWALKDINFEVQQGEVLGIIGKNGAGKSTLLKILSKVTSPTTGSLKAKGHIASLLEVGTGFHPELTGLENIYLNGAILGMTKAEVKSKLDEIVDFAGVARYLDTPVKRYSSGMMVRLAFSVAAHLEPEIMLIDEVLAVGDAEFQKKCLSKIDSVASQGRTILFVSHVMSSIQTLCTRCIVLKDGSVAFNGDVESAIESYLERENKHQHDGRIAPGTERGGTGEARFLSATLMNKGGKPKEEFLFRENLSLNFEIESSKQIKDALFDIKIVNAYGAIVAYITSTMNGEDFFRLKEGTNTISAELKNNLLPGNYSLTIGLHYSNGLTLDLVDDVLEFAVLKIAADGHHPYTYHWIHGNITTEAHWELIS